MPEAFEHPCWRLESHRDLETEESQAVLDQLLPVLKGLVKTGYNVYMTFYGSEFITVLFYGLQRRNILQDFAVFDSSVSVHLVVEVLFSPLPFILSFSLCFILSLKKKKRTEQNTKEKKKKVLKISLLLAVYLFSGTIHRFRAQKIQGTFTISNNLHLSFGRSNM